MGKASTVIQRSALLFHSAECMYDLVNDVAAYPKFVDHCVATEVIEHSETHMLATIALEKAGVALSFTTLNTLTRPTHIQLQLQDGPFTNFTGRWQFTALREGACKVSLYIEFEMKNAVTSRLASGVLESVSHSLVDAFCKRAEKLYGAGR
ncbi:MAG: type II toxin-antitoxin system RatA family toxin [Pseudomonadales bacterium]